MKILSLVVFCFIASYSGVIAQCDSVLIIHHIHYDEGDITDYGNEIDSIRNGNLITRTDSTHTFEYRYYDSSNRPVSIVNIDDGDSTVYFYDASSRLYMKDYYSGTSNNWNYKSDTARSKIFYKTDGRDSLIVRYLWNGSFHPYYQRVNYFNASDTLFRWEIQHDTGSGILIDSVFNVYYVQGLRIDSGFVGSVFSQYYDEVRIYDSLERVIELQSLTGGWVWAYEQMAYECNQFQSSSGSCNGCHNTHYYFIVFDDSCRITRIQYGASGISADHYERFDYYYSGCNSMSIVPAHDSTICGDDSTTLLTTFYGGVPPYSISWSPANGLAFPDSSQTHASPDTTTQYVVTVTDSIGNSITDTIIVMVYPNPYTNLHIQSIDTTSVCQSAILATDSIAGCYNYWYLNNNGIQTPQTSHLTITQNGTYVLEVNSQVCPSAYDTLVFSGISHPAPTLTLTRGCGVIIANTNVPCTIKWYYNSNLITGTTGDTLTVVNSGNYSAEAYDANGCYSTTQNLNYFQNNYQLVVYNTCPDTCSGRISLNNSAASVSWSTGSTASKITHLCPGIYTAIVTDYFGCTYTLSASVDTLPFISMHNIVVPASNSTACDGSAIIVDSLNNAYAFTPFWPDGTTDRFKDSLCSGWYYINVSPVSTMCMQHDTVFIPFGVVTDTCTALMNVNGITCHGANNGSISVSSSAGNSFACQLTSPLNNISFSPVLNFCSPGQYSCILIDSTGCTDTATVTITEPPAIAYTYSNYQSPCGDSCSMSVSVTGGVPPYTYHWTDNSTNSYSLTCAVSSTVRITDHNGCNVFYNATQPTVNPLVINPNSVPASCMTCSDATIYMNPTGGQPPYTYAYDGVFSTSDSLPHQFLPGLHEVCMTGSDSCSVCQMIYVSFNTAITETSEGDIRIFPNPAHDFAIVSLGFEMYNATYRVTDYLGKIVDMGRIKENQFSIRTNFTTGLYLLTVQNSEKLIRKNIMVIH